MKPRPEIIGDKVELLGLYGNVSPEEMEAARVQALKHFESAASELAREEVEEAAAARLPSMPRWIAAAAITAAIALAVLQPTRIMQSAPAVLEDQGRSRKIQYGEIVRPSGDATATLEMADGARVEIRAESELLLERADNGVRVRLHKGDVIVSTSRESESGEPLSVATNDISAVGNVFLVNATEEGSRVGVIDGEVRIRQGALEKKLLPGDQLTTSPLMGLQPVGKEIAWSRQRMEHLALLAQSSANLAAVASQNSRTADAFELVSIRPRASSGGGARGQVGSSSPPACGGSPPQIDPRRFVVTNVTLYRLITMAFGKSCGVLELLDEIDLMPDGPDWIRSDKFDIEALLPEGSPGYTRQQLSNGDAPVLQAMLQNMLSDRFRLEVHRLTKEARVYTINRLPGPIKLTPSKDEEVAGAGLSTGLNPVGKISTHIGGRKASMTTLASQLGVVTRMPVLDRTGITGEFTYSFEFAPLETTPAVAEIRANGRWPFLSGPTLFDVLEEQLGLKLQMERGPVEVLVIDHAERPSEN